MKHYFITQWNLGLYMLTEYWPFYLIGTVILTFVVLKYEKKIFAYILKLVDKFRNLLLDIENETETQK